MEPERFCCNSCGYTTSKLSSWKYHQNRKLKCGAAPGASPAAPVPDLDSAGPSAPVPTDVAGPSITVSVTVPTPAPASASAENAATPVLKSLLDTKEEFSCPTCLRSYRYKGSLAAHTRRGCNPRRVRLANGLESDDPEGDSIEELLANPIVKRKLDEVIVNVTRDVIDWVMTQHSDSPEMLRQLEEAKRKLDAMKPS